MSRNFTNILLLGVFLACDGRQPGSSLTDPSATRLSFGAATAEGARVWTDKDDYVPHEPVLVMGSGWEPGETVTLTLTEDPPLHPNRRYTVGADQEGAFAFEGFAPDEHDAGIRFLLTAMGHRSGSEAWTTFTDGIALGSYSTNNNGTGDIGSSQLVLSAPATSAGDLLVAQVTAAKDFAASDVICTPPGWTSLVRHDQNLLLVQQIFYRVVPSAEPVTSHTWEFRTTGGSCGTSNDMRINTGASGAVIRYTGVDPANPIDAFAGSSGNNAGPYRAPAVTTTSPDALVLRFFGANAFISITPLTRLYVVGGSSNSAPRSSAAFQAVQAAAGSSGTFDAAFTSPADWVAHTVALRAAVACVAPAVTVHPVSQTVGYGTNPTFSAAASGTPAPGAQWQVSADQGANWVDVPGATSTSYTVPGATVGLSGTQYRVRFSNPCGSATSNPATLTVDPKPVDPWIDAEDKVYDGTTTASLVAQGVTGVIGQDVVTLDVGAASFDTKDVGNGKTVTATGLGLGGADATNYVLSTGSTTDLAAITAATLTATADDKTRMEGEANPAFTVTYTGFAAGEGPGLVSGTPNLSTSANAASPPGDYPIVWGSPSGVAVPNYTIVTVDGTLTVTPSQASSGFVTGAGWFRSPPEACAASACDGAPAGRAGLALKAGRPAVGGGGGGGQPLFQFQVGGLSFTGTVEVEVWFSGAQVQYRGEGTVNGVSGYGVLLTAVDGDLEGAGGVDRLRIRVFHQLSGEVLYDSQMGDGDGANPVTALTGGNITIHKRP